MQHKFRSTLEELGVSEYYIKRILYANLRIFASSPEAIIKAIEIHKPPNQNPDLFLARATKLGTNKLQKLYFLGITSERQLDFFKNSLSELQQKYLIDALQNQDSNRSRSQIFEDFSTKFVLNADTPPAFSMFYGLGLSLEQIKQNSQLILNFSNQNLPINSQRRYYEDIKSSLGFRPNFLDKAQFVCNVLEYCQERTFERKNIYRALYFNLPGFESYINNLETNTDNDWINSINFLVPNFGVFIDYKFQFCCALINKIIEQNCNVEIDRLFSFITNYKILIEYTLSENKENQITTDTSILFQLLDCTNLRLLNKYKDYIKNSEFWDATTANKLILRLLGINEELVDKEIFDGSRKWIAQALIEYNGELPLNECVKLVRGLHDQLEIYLVMNGASRASLALLNNLSIKAKEELIEFVKYKKENVHTDEIILKCSGAVNSFQLRLIKMGLCMNHIGANLLSEEIVEYVLHCPKNIPPFWALANIIYQPAQTLNIFHAVDDFLSRNNWLLPEIYLLRIDLNLVNKLYEEGVFNETNTRLEIYKKLCAYLGVYEENHPHFDDFTFYRQIKIESIRALTVNLPAASGLSDQDYDTSLRISKEFTYNESCKMLCISKIGYDAFTQKWCDAEIAFLDGINFQYADYQEIDTNADEDFSANITGNIALAH